MKKGGKFFSQTATLFGIAVCTYVCKSRISLRDYSTITFCVKVFSPTVKRTK